jgi:hypothetical protein
MALVPIDKFPPASAVDSLSERLRQRLVSLNAPHERGIPPFFLEVEVAYPLPIALGLMQEVYWNGAKLLNVSAMLAWAGSMTWKRFHPIILLNSKIYQKGISLNKSAMKEVEKRLERNPLLPKWDILIRP